MAFPGWQASEDSIYRVAAEWLVLVKYGDACTTCGEQRAHRHGFRPRRRVAEQAGVPGGRGWPGFTRLAEALFLLKAARNSLSHLPFTLLLGCLFY